MKKFDAVLWDLDGTLLNTLADLTDSVNFALSHYGMPERTQAQVCSYIGTGARNLISLAVLPGTEDAKIDEICTFFREYYAKNCDIKTGPYEGILTLLEKLKNEGIKLAIISNKPDRATKILSRLYFGDYVDIAVGENEAAGIRRKPAPDAVLAAIDELGVEKERCVYIGDSETDVFTAKNSGLPCISVTWGFRDRETLIKSGAEKLIDTAAELEEFLLGR